MENAQPEAKAECSKGTSVEEVSAEKPVEDSGIYSGNISQPRLTTSEDANQFLKNATKENTSSSTFCSKVLSTQHLFREENYIYDPTKPIERAAVEVKFEKLKLRRVFSSSSMDFLTEKSSRILGPLPVKSSRSWSDFGEWTNQIDGQFKRDGMLPDEESYIKSCEIYKMLTKFPNYDLKERFELAQYLLPKYYPNYWKYLNKIYTVEPDPDLFLEEVECKYKVIKSCKDILMEEENYYKYSVNVIGRRRRIAIKGKLFTLNRDFHAAGKFLKKEYPNVFAYLIQKYQFVKFLMDRLKVEKNKLLLIEASIQPLEKLLELEAQYAIEFEEGK